MLLISGAGRISVTTARACGASGFVPKDWPAADIARAVRMVALGMALFEPAPAAAEQLVLTGREREVLERVAGGATNREIAADLHLSPHTVKEHTSALYRKLEVRNRAEAVQRAQRLGPARLSARPGPLGGGGRPPRARPPPTRGEPWQSDGTAATVRVCSIPLPPQSCSPDRAARSPACASSSRACAPIC